MYVCSVSVKIHNREDVKLYEQSMDIEPDANQFDSTAEIEKSQIQELQKYHAEVLKYNKQLGRHFQCFQVLAGINF